MRIIILLLLLQLYVHAIDDEYEPLLPRSQAAIIDKDFEENIRNTLTVIERNIERGEKKLKVFSISSSTLGCIVFADLGFEFAKNYTGSSAIGCFNGALGMFPLIITSKNFLEEIIPEFFPKAFINNSAPRDRV